MVVFLTSDSSISLNAQELADLASGYDIVIGTGSTYEAYQTALVNRLMGQTYHLLGAGCTEKEVEELIESAQRTVLVLIVDSLASDCSVSLIKRVKTAHPSTRTILLVNNLIKASRVSDVREIYDGIVSASSIGHGGILKCLKTILEEQSPFIDPVLENELSQSDLDEVNSLNQRERQILPLLARGLKNREIAQELYIAEKTARDYVSSIINKLHVANRSAAAAWAAERGLAI